MPFVDTDEFQSYFVRIRPVFPLVFNIAHLITGNFDEAEYCVQCAILDCWLAGENNGSIHGFRESLRNRVIKAALKSKNSSREFDWTGMTLTEADNGPILTQLCKESVENRRAIVLHYSCGFTPRRCASLCGMETAKVRNLIDRFERRIERKLTSAEKRKLVATLPKFFRGLLSRPDPKAPEFSSVFRAFQSDALETQRPNRLPARIIRIILAIILTLLCVVGFFLAAVLMQPAEITPRAQQTIENFQP